MSDHSHVDEVGSGVPYTVTLVNGHAASDLEDFVSADVLVMSVARAGHEVTVHGAARRLDDIVVVHEKSLDGNGKDVRTWQVARADHQFEAVERSMF